MNKNRIDFFEVDTINMELILVYLHYRDVGIDWLDFFLKKKKNMVAYTLYIHLFFFSWKADFFFLLECRKMGEKRPFM